MECITPLRRSRTAFAKMLGGYGEEVREDKDIQPALRRAGVGQVCADQCVGRPGSVLTGHRARGDVRTN
jgi:hypothetical protein